MSKRRPAKPRKKAALNKVLVHQLRPGDRKRYNLAQIEEAAEAFCRWKLRNMRDGIFNEQGEKYWVSDWLRMRGRTFAFEQGEYTESYYSPCAATEWPNR